MLLFRNSMIRFWLMTLLLQINYQLLTFRSSLNWVYSSSSSRLTLNSSIQRFTPGIKESDMQMLMLSKHTKTTQRPTKPLHLSSHLTSKKTKMKLFFTRVEFQMLLDQLESSLMQELKENTKLKTLIFSRVSINKRPTLRLIQWLKSQLSCSTDIWWMKVTQLWDF